MKQTKHIGERISYQKGESLTVQIIANSEKNKENILLLWLVLWVVIGISTLGYLFTQNHLDENSKIVIYVFLGFWLYYLYKMTRAYRWLAKGVEVIEVTDDNFVITNKVSERGLPLTYAIKEISPMIMRDVEPTSFQFQMENSFWVIGGDRIAFESNGSTTFFGKKLNDKDARKLIKLLNEFIKR